MTEATTTTRLTYRPLESLSRWQRNYNRGDVVAIKNSICRFGFNGALRVWKDQVIMAGNHTWLALCELRDEGREPVGEGARVSDDGTWSVLCIDVSHLSIQEAEAFAIADNRTAALATQDEDQLAELLNELGTDPTLLEGIGYSEDEVDALLARLAGGNDEVDDPGPCEPLDQPTAKLGDIWLLGNHRLLCGDSTNPGDVERLMAAETARLLATDPPYCVDYTGNDRPTVDGNASGKDWSQVYREIDIKDLGEFLRGAFGAVLPHVDSHAAVYLLARPRAAANDRDGLRRVRPSPSSGDRMGQAGSDIRTLILPVEARAVCVRLAPRSQTRARFVPARHGLGGRLGGQGEGGRQRAPDAEAHQALRNPNGAAHQARGHRP